MSKVTIITSSPRKDSNSNQLAQWFKEEAEQLGAEVAEGHSLGTEIRKIAF